MTPNERRRSNIAARRKIRADMKDRGFNFAEVRFLDRLVEGMPWADAARASGVPKWKAGNLIAMPEFRAELFRRMTAVRAAEGPRNLALALKLRDDGFEPNASAADKRVALEAVRHLEGTDLRPGTVVNVGVKIGPGLIVDLSDDEAEPPMRDVTPTQRVLLASPPAHLRGPVDMGEEPEEAAEVRQESTPAPLISQPTEPGFRRRTFAQDVPRPIQIKPYHIKPRG